MGRALIIGSAGQDGHYLAELLSRKGYWVAGVDRPDRSQSSSMLDAYWSCDLRDPSLIPPIIESSNPSEIYYLAALNYSSEDQRLRTVPVLDLMTVNLSGAAVTLSTIMTRFPSCRFFYAGSCHVFGSPLIAPQNEDTPHKPTTPYGISKSAGLRLCTHFRESCGVFSVGGILFNHESPLRRPPFVTARIAHAAALVSIGKGQQLEIQNANALVDWGAASDFVEAMWCALAHAVPDDYVIATGVPHTVAEFADEAFRRVGARWEDWVVQQPPPSTRNSAPYVGDSSRMKRATGWHPTTSFQALVWTMVDERVKDLGSRT